MLAADLEDKHFKESHQSQADFVVAHIACDMVATYSVSWSQALP